VEEVAADGAEYRMGIIRLEMDTNKGFILYLIHHVQLIFMVFSLCIAPRDSAEHSVSFVMLKPSFLGCKRGFKASISSQ
jgi:hypothetical protein